MVTKKDNNKQENMVNNEQKTHTEAHQEESWLAKNKNMVGIGGVLFLPLQHWYGASLAILNKQSS